MFLGYLIVCIGVWANLQTLMEMTNAFPTSGNYIDYADRWVDPALAFGAGLAEGLGELIVRNYILWNVHGLILCGRVDVCFRF